MTCLECSDYTCERFARRKWGSEYLSINAIDNLETLKQTRYQNLLRERKKRRLRVERLIGSYNNGRSMTFYCRVYALLPVGEVERAIEEAEKVFLSDHIAQPS